MAWQEKMGKVVNGVTGALNKGLDKGKVEMKKVSLNGDIGKAKDKIAEAVIAMNLEGKELPEELVVLCEEIKGIQSEIDNLKVVKEDGSAETSEDEEVVSEEDNSEEESE